MSQTVLITSGEYSDYHVEALLNVPSMDWLRERFAEYEVAKRRLEDYLNEHGYYYSPGEKQEELLRVHGDIIDRDQLDFACKVEFGKWLCRKYNLPTVEYKEARLGRSW